MDCCGTDEKSGDTKNMDEKTEDSKEDSNNEPNNSFNGESNNAEKVNGGKSIKMERRIWLWIIIGVLFIAVLFLIFKAGAGGATANVVQAAGSAAQRVVPSSSGMVGGC